METDIITFTKDQVLDMIVDFDLGAGKHYNPRIDTPKTWEDRRIIAEMWFNETMENKR